jgi:hypothetical protein
MADQKHPLTSHFPPGLSQPAVRALAGAGCQTLEDVTRFSQSELNQLHGMGPRGVEILRLALSKKGLAFAGQKKENDGKHA